MEIFIENIQCFSSQRHCSCRRFTNACGIGFWLGGFAINTSGAFVEKIDRRKMCKLISSERGKYILLGAI